MSFRFPYLALDIETTGVDRQRSHVLQLAAVYDNGKNKEDLPTFNAVVRWPVITHGEEYALNLNKGLLERASKNDRVLPVQQVRINFDKWLEQVQPNGKITIAGKNAAGFDVPILENAVNGFVFKRFLRRVLDPGSVYADEFDHIPSMDEINQFLGRPAVSHDALDDCWDVVYAMRHKWNAPLE